MGPDRAGRDARLTDAEAFAGLAFAAMCCDGVIAAEEDADLVDALAGLPLFTAAGEPGIRRALARVERLSREVGDDGLVEIAARSVPEPLRGQAFLLVAGIVGADGEMGPDERRFLERARLALGLDLAQAGRIASEAGLPGG